jgi:hypothetical protein
MLFVVVFAAVAFPLVNSADDLRTRLSQHGSIIIIAGAEPTQHEPLLTRTTSLNSKGIADVVFEIAPDNW